jgi:hypothetical protein
MTGTNERLAIVTDARAIGVMRATGQPVNLGMAGRADPQRTTDFQAVLLAMAGHDLRGPLQIIQGSHDLSASASGPNPNNVCCRGASMQSNTSMGCSINCWGLFGSMSIQRRQSSRPSRLNRCLGKHAMKMRKARCRRGLTSVCAPLARPS